MWRWVQRFGRRLRGLLHKLGLKLRGEWCADEMHVRVGGTDGWDWEVMHAETRLARQRAQ